MRRVRRLYHQWQGAFRLHSLVNRLKVKAPCAKPQMHMIPSGGDGFDLCRQHLAQTTGGKANIGQFLHRHEVVQAKERVFVLAKTDEGRRSFLEGFHMGGRKGFIGSHLVQVDNQLPKRTHPRKARIVDGGEQQRVRVGQALIITRFGSRPALASSIKCTVLFT